MTTLNNSIHRAVSILRILSEESSLGLSEISRLSNLHKSTVHRIMQTLLTEGWVYRRQGDARFQISANIPFLSNPLAREQLIAEATGPVLRRLQRHTDGWPLVISVLSGVRMQVVETSGDSPRLKLYDDVMEFQPHILWSAMGRAYLSFCPELERQAIFKQLQSSNDKFDRITQNPHLINRFISETRANGYGIRDQRYTERFSNYGFQLSAIAVPVLFQEQVLATITLMWIQGEAELSTMTEGCLSPMLQAAQAVSELIKDFK